MREAPAYYPRPADDCSLDLETHMGLAPRCRTLLFCLGLTAAGPAWAQDDFDLDSFDEEEEEEEAAPKPVEDDGELDTSDPDDDDSFMAPEEDDGEEFQFEDDLTEQEEGTEVKTRGPGEDTASLYREALEEYGRMGADEEALAWERYLKKWPNSIFRDRIEQRLDELNEELYEGRLNASYRRTADAGKAELLFSQPLQLENIDPRSKIRAGFEWGIPSYINFIADYEHQIFRELSVHAGVRRRFTGSTLETGARYALVKSARTGLLVTAIGDFRYNLDPAFPAVRPQLGLGKQIDIGSTRIDVNLQGGSDLTFIPNNAGDTVFDPRWVGGGNIMVIPNETVRVFMEASTYMKAGGENETVGGFVFNQMSVGIQFVQRKSKTEERLSTALGASVPYLQRYWGYHSGSVAGDLNFFL